MKVLSLTDLFYEISGVKPRVSDVIVGVRQNPVRSLDLNLVPQLDPKLAGQRFRKFLSKEKLTRDELQFDKEIPIHCRYPEENRPTARGDYQEGFWKDLLWARSADGWGAGAKAAIAAEAIRQRVASDTSMFGIRSRLFCDMVMISAGENIAPNPLGALGRLRSLGRQLTKAFLSQKDFLSAAICLLQESLLARNQATIDRQAETTRFALAANKAAQDLLIGRPKEYDQRLVNLVLFHTAGYGFGTAATVDDRKQALLQKHLMENVWEDLADDASLRDWLLFTLLGAQSGYYLFSGEDDKCAESLLRVCSLYDRLNQNLPILSLLGSICQWAARTRPNTKLREIATTYLTRWKNNPRLCYLPALRWLSGWRDKPSVYTSEPTAGQLTVGARIGILSKENGLLRL